MYARKTFYNTKFKNKNRVQIIKTHFSFKVTDINIKKFNNLGEHFNVKLIYWSLIMQYVSHFLC